MDDRFSLVSLVVASTSRIIEIIVIDHLSIFVLSMLMNIVKKLLNLFNFIFAN